MKNRIWLSPPHMAGREREFVNEAFDTNWIAPVGPNLTNFEQAVQKYCDVNHAVGLSSGTAAIHLALKNLNVNQGDIVFCQSLTFIGTISPVIYENAVPVFVDSEMDSWNMDPELLEEGIKTIRCKGKKIKAIIPVHLYGMPAKMNEILEIAARYDIPVVEDAAEALGSEYFGKKCGSLSEMGVLSFNGNKIITTSGGGMLTTKSENFKNYTKFLSTQARDQEIHYEHSQVGYNYRLSNVLAGIGRGQLEVLDDFVEARRRNFLKYFEYFSTWNDQGFNVEFQNESVGSSSNRWLTAIVINPKKNKGLTRHVLMDALADENIESRPVWKPMHLQPALSSYRFIENGYSAILFEHGLCLPSGSSLTEEEFTRITDVIDKVMKRY